MLPQVTPRDPLLVELILHHFDLTGVSAFMRDPHALPDSNRLHLVYLGYDRVDLCDNSQAMPV